MSVLILKKERIFRDERGYCPYYQGVGEPGYFTAGEFCSLVPEKMAAQLLLLTSLPRQNHYSFHTP